MKKLKNYHESLNKIQNLNRQIYDDFQNWTKKMIMLI